MYKMVLTTIDNYHLNIAIKRSGENMNEIGIRSVADPHYILIKSSEDSRHSAANM